jgi:hypothetical protein
MSRNLLKERIYGCGCSRCRAIVVLSEKHGASLQFVAGRAGRLCELAVVAASGSEGISAHDVVVERREYASHIGVQLKGHISNSNDPIHICHAIDHSNHNSKARNRINIGSAHASYFEGRFFLF